MTGPVVSGSPTSQPATDWPQRRPTRLAAQINNGLATSFRATFSIPAYAVDETDR